MWRARNSVYYFFDFRALRTVFFAADFFAVFFFFAAFFLVATCSLRDCGGTASDVM